MNTDANNSGPQRSDSLIQGTVDMGVCDLPLPALLLPSRRDTEVCRTALGIARPQPDYLFRRPRDPIAHVHLPVGHLKGGPRRTSIYPPVKVVVCLDATPDAL